MSSKLFTTVLALATIVPFGYYATQDAVRVTDTLREQTNTIQQLTVESEKIEKDLKVKQEAKEQTEQEVVEVEQNVNDMVSERQKLEAELRGN